MIRGASLGHRFAHSVGDKRALTSGSRFAVVSLRDFEKTSGGGKLRIAETIKMFKFVLVQGTKEMYRDTRYLLALKA